MIRKFPVLLCALAIAMTSFSQEKASKTSWYTSLDSRGYISIKKVDASASTTLQTTVNANFGNEVLNFNLETLNDGTKMVSPSKLAFTGTMDSNMEEVVFEGNRIKDSKKASYWNFKGDFMSKATTDPELKRFFPEQHQSTLRIPERTIPTFNLWAVIPQLKFDKAGTFKFNALDETKLYVRKNQTVNYLGQFETNINGETLKLHKFVHQGKKMEPAYFWVNDDRELVQVRLDGKYTFTLSTKEAAMQTEAFAQTRRD